MQIQVFEHDWMSRSSGFKRVLFNGTHRGCLYMGKVNFKDSNTPLPDGYWDLPIAEVYHVSGFAGAYITINGVETAIDSYGDVIASAGVS